MTVAAAPRADSQALDDFVRTFQHVEPAAPRQAPRISLNSTDAKNGLAKLVLTLIELIRELLERQAIRRVEAGSLSDEEVERLGAAFLQLSEQMQRLKREFGLEDEDLNLDLGPLGKLI
ncbi:MAG TPA: gas vesicle protein K [Pirellulales bacterium]|nr:gas vesicle protein K [Pirellulales bacterium]